MNNLNGKIVRFLSGTGNEFREGEIAVCLNEEERLFLGLQGINVGRVWSETREFEVLETFKPVIENALSEMRNRYHSA